jgi:hypothetical protein
MAILRHEAGHAVQHAYQPQRRRRWQQLFGPSSKRYPRHYRPNPASRRFVQHLRLWYAQSHPHGQSLCCPSEVRAPRPAQSKSFVEKRKLLPP